MSVRRDVANGRRLIETSAIIVKVYPRLCPQMAIILIKVCVVLVHKQYKTCDYVSVLLTCAMFIQSRLAIVQQITSILYAFGITGDDLDRSRTNI